MPEQRSLALPALHCVNRVYTARFTSCSSTTRGAKGEGESRGQPAGGITADERTRQRQRPANKRGRRFQMGRSIAVRRRRN